MTTPTTIELPRLPNERLERYEARTTYILMGASRSLEAVRQKTGKKPASLRNIERWSAEDNWPELAAQHDQTIYTLAAQAQSDQYQDDLKAFRVKYGKTGDDLHKVASSMLALFARNLQGQKIEGKDGKVYIIPAVEMNVSTLGQIKAALQTAADLEALALRVEGLLSEPRSE